MSATNSRFRRRRKFREEKIPIGVKREARRLELASQLKEAREQVVYYRGKRVLATTPPDRARLGALVLAWDMTRQALETKLAEHNNGKVAA